MVAKRKTTTNAKVAEAGTPHQDGVDFANLLDNVGKAVSSFFDGLNEQSLKNRLEAARARLPDEEKKLDWDREAILFTLTEAGKPMPMKDLKAACGRIGLTTSRTVNAVGHLIRCRMVRVDRSPEAIVRLIKRAQAEAPPAKPETEAPVAGHMFANDFAQALGVSRDQVESWIAWGMPHERHKLRLGGPVSIPLLAACAWIHARQNTPPAKATVLSLSDEISFAPPTASDFEAAKPRPAKLPELKIPVSVDAILGIDAELRNAIARMRHDDMHALRVALQRAINLVEPLFDETAVALTASRATVFVKASDLRGGETPMRVRRAIMEGRAQWAAGENEGDLLALMIARDNAAGFRWTERRL